MDKYKILGLFWGPIALAVVLSGFFYWRLRPDLKTIRVPTVPRDYREVPRVNPERIRYLPLEPVKGMAFLPPKKPLPSRTRSGPAPDLSPRSVLELKAVLKIGPQKVCKINDKLLKEGQEIGPFKIVFIGDNYVELYGQKTRVRLLVGEKLSF